MSPLGITHALIGLLALAFALAVFLRRKGDRIHRVLGWVFLPLMGASLAIAIWMGIARSFHTFNAYAVVTLLALVGALLASRFRQHLADWRFWHAGLMSFTVLSACVAISGVVGGMLIGEFSGPGFFRVFNFGIAGVTALGLLILTPHLRRLASPDRAQRALWTYHGGVVTLTLIVITLQTP